MLEWHVILGGIWADINYCSLINLIFVPAMMFVLHSVRVQPGRLNWWQSHLVRLAIIIVTIGLSHLLMNLGVHLKWELHHAGFDTLLNPTETQRENNITDGLNLGFTLLFGWIFASLYAMICWVLWHVIKFH